MEAINRSATEHSDLRFEPVELLIARGNALRNESIYSSGARFLSVLKSALDTLRRLT